MTNEELRALLAVENPAAQPRPKMTGADVRRMLTPQAQYVQSGPSVPERVARSFAGRLGEIGSYFGRGAALMPAIGEPLAVALPPEQATPEQTGEAIASLVSGPPTPGQLRADRAPEMAGEWMGDAAAAAPLVGGMAASAGVRPAYAIIAEMLGAAGGGAVSGGLASDEGEETIQGLGTGSLLAAAPGVVLGGPAQKAEAAIRGTRAARRAMTPAAYALRERIGDVSLRAFADASSELKREVPFVEKYIEALTEAERLTANRPGGVSSRQVADAMPFDEGGGGFAHMEEGISRTDAEYRRKRARRRSEGIRSLSEEWSMVSPAEPDYDTFITGYDEAQDMLKQAERDAWTRAMQEDMNVPLFDITGIRETANRIASEARYKAGDIPQVVKDVIDRDVTPEDFLDIRQFQELRSVLLGVVRDAKINPTSSNKHGAAMAVELLDEISDQMKVFDRLDDSGMSEAWREARRLTRENAEFYDPRSPVIQSLERGGPVKGLLAAVRNAKGRRGQRIRPKDEAARLVRIANQTPGGIENLRALAIEDLFVEGLNPTATRTPRKTLVQNEWVYREILGEQQYDKALELLELSRLYTIGKAGTNVQAMSVGSGQSPAQFLFQLARAATDPVGQVVEGATKALAPDELMVRRVIRTALEEPEAMRVLMEMPTEANLPEWMVNWRKLLSQAGQKTLARSAGRPIIEQEFPGTGQ